MRTMRPNLHLNLNLPLGNNSKMMTPTNANSGFMTPIDQIHPGPALRSGSVYSVNSDDDVAMEQVTPSNTNISKCNSVTSIASSVASAYPVSDIHTLHINYDAQFDELILQTYQSYSNRPDITPFNPRFPPSGIAHKVSKEVYHHLIKTGIRIDSQQEQLPPQNQTLMIIRKRLFELCHDSGIAGDSTPLTRQNSNSSILLQRQNSGTGMGSGVGNGAHKPSWLHYNPSFTVNRMSSSTDSLVESVPQNIQVLSRSNNMHTPKKLDSLTPPSSSSEQMEYDQFTFEKQGKVLQSPFQETHFNFKQKQQMIAHKKLDMSDIEVDPLFNATSQRKRDSLKLKRNMK